MYLFIEKNDVFSIHFASKFVFLYFKTSIFFTPITKVAPVEIEEDDLRDTDAEIIESIDNIFKAVHREHEHNPKTTFFITDDKPAIIEVFGDRHERIQILKLYMLIK